jgi:hypothetical protein
VKPPSPDQAFIDSIEDSEQRQFIEEELARYRRPDQLSPGDRVPPLELMDLNDSKRISLHGHRSVPLVLLFGSYT